MRTGTLRKGLPPHRSLFPMETAYNCPFCGASPRKPCHVKDNPSRITPYPHRNRGVIVR